MDLQVKVEILLDLLDDVEKRIDSDPSSLSKEVGVHLADRLYHVADLADRRYNVVEVSDESQSAESGQLGVTPSASVRVKHESGAAPSTPPVAVKKEKRGVPSPPMRAPTTSQAVVPTYNRFTNPQPLVLDEPAKKRCREAEALVRGLDRPKSFSCGISYQGDDKEKEFGEGIKNDLKRQMPALKNHRHIFRYMAWATMERIECQHCRKCTNTYP